MMNPAALVIIRASALATIIGSSYALVDPDGSCPLLTMIPFSDSNLETSSGFQRWIPESLRYHAFTYMASAQLAIDHFNTRDNYVVPELSSLEDCSVFFPPQMVMDTQSDPWKAVQDLLNTTSSRDLNLCGVIGPNLERAVLKTASITGGMGIPQMVYRADEDIVTNIDNPSTVGVALRKVLLAQAMVSYLQRPGLERKFLGIAFDGDPVVNMMDLRFGIELVKAKYGIETLYLDHPQSNTGSLPTASPPTIADDEIRLVVSAMKSSGLRTFYMLLPDPDTLARYAGILAEEGMLTNDYLYFLLDDSVSTVEVGSIFGRQEPGSPIDLLLRGAAVISSIDGFSWDSQDRFLASWRKQNSSFVDRVNSLLPMRPGDSGYIQGNSSFFQSSEPASFASYVYDSVMALGFGSCALDLRANPGLDRRGEHVRAILNTSFTGASGRVSFDGGRKARDPSGVTVGAYNIRATQSDPTTGLCTYEAVLTSVTKSDGSWEDVDGEVFIYRDGTTEAPTLLRVILDENFLSPWVRAVGLTLFAIAWTMSIGSMFLVWLLRNDDIVRRGQPPFLLLLCFGSMTLSTGILTLSWDESYGWSDHQLDIACSLTPWFFFIGHNLMFSAMFTKLWRVDRVLQFRRGQTVKISQVILPLIILLVVTVAILTVWTVVDPYRWERSIISENPPESYGECTSDHFKDFFAALGSVIVFGKLAAAFMAWKTSDIPQALCESDSVVYAILTHLQAWFVGVPILAVLGNDSANATYFGRVLLIWIFAVSGIGMVVLPKLTRAILLRLNPDREQRAPRVRVTGIDIPAKHRSPSLGLISATITSLENHEPSCINST